MSEISPAPFRVALVRPATTFAKLEFPDGPRIGMPLGLLYIASAFRDDPLFEARLFDALAEPDLDEVRRQRGPVRFGESLAALAARLQSWEPRLVGVTCGAREFFSDCVETVEAIRRALPDAVIVVGGCDPSSQPEAYLERAPGLDAVVCGEGEVTCREIAERLREDREWRETRGLVLRDGDGDGDGFRRNPAQPWIEDLDAYLPDFGAIDMERYFRLNAEGFRSRGAYDYPGVERTVDLVTSRGCPFRCTFCSIHIHMGRPFRPHSPGYVVGLLEHLVERYDVRHFHFEDDNLTLDRERFAEILRGIIGRGLRITWDTPNGVRADGLDRPLVELCKRSGCAYLIFGVESGSQRVLDEVVAKDLDLAAVARAAAICQQVGIDSLAFYLVGLPGETRAEQQSTYDLAFDLLRRYGTAPVLMLARPLRKTAMREAAEQREQLVPTDRVAASERYRIPFVLLAEEMVQTDDFTLDDVAEVFNRYAKRVLLETAASWVKVVGRAPGRLVGNLASLLFAVGRRPRQAKAAFYRFVFGKAMFPWACRRRVGERWP